jgi:hypothetical protein
VDAGERGKGKGEPERGARYLIYTIDHIHPYFKKELHDF